MSSIFYTQTLVFVFLNNRLLQTHKAQFNYIWRGREYNGRWGFFLCNVQKLYCKSHSRCTVISSVVIGTTDPTHSCKSAANQSIMAVSDLDWCSWLTFRIGCMAASQHFSIPSITFNNASLNCLTRFTQLLHHICSIAVITTTSYKHDPCSRTSSFPIMTGLSKLCKPNPSRSSARLLRPDSTTSSLSDAHSNH